MGIDLDPLKEQAARVLNRQSSMWLPKNVQGRFPPRKLIHVPPVHGLEYRCLLQEAHGSNSSICCQFCMVGGSLPLPFPATQKSLSSSTSFPFLELQPCWGRCSGVVLHVNCTEVSTRTGCGHTSSARHASSPSFTPGVHPLLERQNRFPGLITTYLHTLVPCDSSLEVFHPGKP